MGFTWRIFVATGNRGFCYSFNWFYVKLWLSLFGTEFMIILLTVLPLSQRSLIPARCSHSFTEISCCNSESGLSHSLLSQSIEPVSVTVRGCDVAGGCCVWVSFITSTRVSRLVTGAPLPRFIPTPAAPPTQSKLGRTAFQRSICSGVNSMKRPSPSRTVVSR